MKYTYSVIIPCYTASEDDFRKCLDSIKNQTLSPLEVICIDDASPIETPKIAKEYGYIYLRNAKNKQNAATRNIGMKMAKGDYLIFVNSDDYLDLNALEEIDKVNNGEDLILIGIRGFGKYDYIIVPKKIDCPLFHKAGVCGEPLHICNRQFILENSLFELEDVVIADKEWSIRVEEKANTYNFVSKPLYNYQLHKESTSYLVENGLLENNLNKI